MMYKQRLFPTNGLLTNTRNSILFILVVMCGLTKAGAQGIVNNGGLFIANNASLYLTGSIQNRSGATLNNTGSIRLSDSLISPGTLNGNGKILFYGSNSKIVSGQNTCTNKLFLEDGSGELFIQEDVAFSDSIYLGSNSKINLNGKNISINGTISGPGFIKSNGLSSVSIGGTGSAGALAMDQSIPGVSNSLKNFTLNRSSGSVQLRNDLEIEGTVTLTSGTLNTGNNLTLKSSSLVNTARIGKIQPTADINGRVTAQRFVPAGSAKRWMFLGSPVDSFDFSQLIDDIHVTGPGGAANGFDPTSSNNPSTYFYDETVAGGSGTGWVSPSTINASLVAGRGWRSFYRGNKATQGAALLSANPPAPQSVVLDYTGSVNKGTINIPVNCSNGCGSNDGWNLVANPYPSPVDWDAATGWTKTNISPVIYVYNPNTNIYAVWDGVVGLNGGSGYIPVGQAFFIKATGAPVLAMTEDVKISSLPSTQMFKSGNNFLLVKLVQDSLVSDETAIKFYGRGNNLDYDEDALKMMGPLNVFSVSSDNYSLAINNHLPLSVADTIRLGVSVTQQRAYELEFSMLNTLPGTTGIQLKDDFTGTLTDLRLNPVYTFNVTADPASQGNNRFKLLFADSSASLPLTLVRFAARPVNNTDVKLDWITTSEVNTKSFIVERSTDNKTFEPLKELAATGSVAVNRYYYTDQQAFAAAGADILYYRLKQVDADGTYTYSGTQTAGKQKLLSKDNIELYPVPATDELNIRAKLNTGEHIKYEILNTTGSIQMSGEGTAPLKIDVGNLSPGVYFIRLSDNTDTTNHSFIKN